MLPYIKLVIIPFRAPNSIIRIMVRFFNSSNLSGSKYGCNNPYAPSQLDTSCSSQFTAHRNSPFTIYLPVLPPPNCHHRRMKIMDGRTDKAIKHGTLDVAHHKLTKFCFRNVRSILGKMKPATQFKRYEPMTRADYRGFLPIPHSPSCGDTVVDSIYRVLVTLAFPVEGRIAGISEQLVFIICHRYKQVILNIISIYTNNIQYISVTFTKYQII